MPRKSNVEPQLQQWLAEGFKYAVLCIVSLSTFYLSQFNKNLEGLTAQLKVMQEQQNADRERIKVIEVSRTENMDSYKRLLNDFSDMKTMVVQLTMRVQTMGEVIAKHWK